jgi:hypothetical protein
MRSRSLLVLVVLVTGFLLPPLPLTRADASLKLYGTFHQ